MENTSVSVEPCVYSPGACYRTSNRILTGLLNHWFLTTGQDAGYEVEVGCPGDETVSVTYESSPPRHDPYQSVHFIIPTINRYGLLTKREVKMSGYWPSSFFACL